ncbi:hypothetical protein [Micromonospora sp. ATA51]|uniref:hypothetical protein n=1 Tax=Micromonospora sp. ATA51 TaxID=2806098 RepID=UPI001A5E5FF0|nr:hypothetical protein [Micromonospora sp. ATA51]MBM0224839.1 hypothetical protein [Micromonospora sp. ATA51]
MGDAAGRACGTHDPLRFVLRRDRVVLDLAAPALVVARRADDPDGATDLARLVDVLITATRRAGDDGRGPASARVVSGIGAR